MRQPIVKIENGKPMTTSVAVADYFDRQHNNVMRDIRNVLAECSESFSLLNFEQSTYQNSRGQTQPMYRLTQDGFAMTALGFTGKKAIQFREAYVRRFREMADKLISQERNALMGQFVRERYLPFEEEVIRSYVTISEAVLHLRILGVHKTLTPGKLKGMVKRGELEGLQNERGHWCIYEDQVKKLATGH